MRGIAFLGVFMLQDESNLESTTSTDGTSEDQIDSPSTPGAGIEFELNAGVDATLCLDVDGAWLDPTLFSTNEIELKPLFAIQIWHKLYAEALLETDSTKLSVMITLAEGAILDRYVELFVSHLQTDETLDLQHAVAALSQLKEINAIGNTAKHSVA